MRLIKPLLGQPEQVCSYLRGLPDEAVVLLVQKRVRDAMAHHANPFDIMYDAQRAAMHLAAIGLSDDGDRLLLVAAAAVQGHKSSVALRAAASAGAMGVLATENAVGSALDIGTRVGWAMGIEMGDAFAKGFESGVKVAGEEVETLLLEAGRAVGVGRCKKCHDVGMQARTERHHRLSGASLPNRQSKGGRSRDRRAGRRGGRSAIAPQHGTGLTPVRS